MKNNIKQYKTVQSMERKFSFTVALTQPTYYLLLRESRAREGTKAVPSRTARRLIEERLDELAADNPTPPPPTLIECVKEVDQKSPVKIPMLSKQAKESKGENGADESAPS